MRWASLKKQLIISLCVVLIGSARAELRDPTQPIVLPTLEVTTGAVEGQFNLQSIIVAPLRIRAMIDGQLVGVGSTIHGARVLAIGKNHVVLLYGGQRKTLYLFGRRLWKHR